MATVPAALAVILVVGYGAIDGLRVSFTDYGGVGSPRWVGTQNYRDAVRSPELRASVVLTLGYAAACAAAMIAIGALLAEAVRAHVRGSAFYRVVWFVPAVVPATAVAAFWSTAFQPETGAVNVALGAVGLGSDHAWLADPATAIYPVIAVTVWSGAGFAFLLLLGAMQQIPTTLYEAASLDGASPTRRFVSITLPLIRPVLAIATTLELIWAANGFAVVYAMTAGGPADATQTLPILVYKQAFVLTDYGLASAMAVISGTALLLVGLLGLRVSRRGI